MTNNRIWRLRFDVNLFRHHTSDIRQRAQKPIVVGLL